MHSSCRSSSCREGKCRGWPEKVCRLCVIALRSFRDLVLERLAMAASKCSGRNPAGNPSPKREFRITSNGAFLDRSSSVENAAVEGMENTTWPHLLAMHVPKSISRHLWQTWLSLIHPRPLPVSCWRCSRAASRLVTSRLRSSLSSFDAGDSSEATASNISHKTSS